tara:strand:+ start:4530 stop:4943 length:414 start_codon:yes stop_codon:yes gene_type:complete
MSLKSLTQRKLSSARSIQIPQEIRKDLRIVTFFNQLLNNIFEIYSILIDNLEFNLVTENITLNESKRYIINADSIVLTLTDSPVDYTEYTIKNISTTNVSIVSNVIEIDGGLSYTIVNQYDSIKLIYISSINKWITL